MKIEKVIRNGKVAVLYSPGFGAGWSTWNERFSNILLFHPKLVEMVENNKQLEINEEWLKTNIKIDGIEDVYTGGAADLCIGWIEEGRQFVVDEYDGSESVLTNEDTNWHTA